MMTHKKSRPYGLFFFVEKRKHPPGIPTCHAAKGKLFTRITYRDPAAAYEDKHQAVLCHSAIPH